MQRSISDVSKMARLIREVERLSERGLHDSAILLCTLLVSKFEDGYPRIRARVALGHALRSDGQIKRALHAYNNCLHDIARLPPNVSTVELDRAMEFENDDDGNELAHDGMDLDAPFCEKKRWRRSSSPQQYVASLTRLTADVKFRIAQCHVTLGQDEMAVSVLESCSMEELPGAGLALLGKLKRRMGAKGGLDLLKASLMSEPFALEVIISLLEMEIDAEEVLQILTLDGKRGTFDWMEQLIRAHGASSTRRYQKASQQFSSLSTQEFPQNPHILSQMAKLELQAGNVEAALGLFARSRAIDPYALEDADIYAKALKVSTEKNKLIQLTHELLNTGVKSRPEPWVSAALLSDLRNDKERALTYVAKASELDPLHLPALHYRGSLLLSKRPMESLASYARALSIKRDFDGLQGLVDAYLAMQPPKVLDAVAIAKEAIELMPNDARSFILMGKALAHTHSTEQLGVDSFFRALKVSWSIPRDAYKANTTSQLDPNNVTACLHLTEIRLSQFHRGELAKEKLLETAILLSRCTHAKGSGIPKDQLYCKIGIVYAIAGDRGRALEAFHAALSLNPHSSDAMNALESLERPYGDDRHTVYQRQPQVSPSSTRRSPGLRLSSPSSPSSLDHSPHMRRRYLAGAVGTGHRG